MDEKRKEELAREAETRTEEDTLLYHIIENHLSVVIIEMALILRELANAPDDERALAMKETITEFAKALATLGDEVLESIPGTLSVEEAKKEVEELLSTRVVNSWLKSSSGDEGPLH